MPAPRDRAIHARFRREAGARFEFLSGVFAPLDRRLTIGVGPR
jgi:hypothetical protein